MSSLCCRMRVAAHLAAMFGFSLAATTTTITTTRPAAAAGYWEVDRGSSTLGRGGANVAAPDDATAVYMNPAALVGVHQGLQVMIDANFAVDGRRFDRLDGNVDGTDMQFPAVDNEWIAGPSPGFFGAYNIGDLGFGRLAVGAGVFGPTRVYRTWSSDGPQRYTEVRYAPVQLNAALAAAYELPWWGLRVGVTGMASRQTVATSLTVHMLTFGGRAENPRYDALIDFRATDTWIPSAVVALSMAPTDWLVLSATHQPSYGVHASGHVDLEVGTGLDGLDVQGDAVRVELRMPAITRAAVMFRDLRRRYDVEVAVVLQAWGGSKSGVFAPEIDIQGARIAPLELKPHWRDTWSLHLGGSYVLLPDLLELRAGSYYERAAVGAAYLNVSQFDLNKVGFTLGARVELPFGMWCDFAAAYVQWLRRNVENSQVMLFDPVDPSADTWTVANGEYSNRQVFLMAALGAEFSL